MSIEGCVAEWTDRVRVEGLEMPDLSLTTWQMRRCLATGVFWESCLPTFAIPDAGSACPKSIDVSAEPASR
jgi:hypothetical protein